MSCRFVPRDPPADTAGALGWAVRGHPGMQLCTSARMCVRKDEIPRAAVLLWKREEGWDSSARRGSAVLLSQSQRLGAKGLV